MSTKTQTGSIDLAPIKSAHDAASQVATNYVTETGGGVGIRVHPEGDTHNYVSITDDIDIVRNDVVVASFGETALIGTESTGRIEVASDGIAGFGVENQPFFEIMASGATEDVWVSTNNYSVEASDAQTITVSDLVNRSADVIKAKTIVKLNSNVLTLSDTFSFGTSSTKTHQYTHPTFGQIDYSIVYDGQYDFVITRNDSEAYSMQIIVSYTKTALVPYFQFGVTPSNIIAAFGAYSVSEGKGTADGDYAHAEGYESYAGGDYSHAEGTAHAIGNYSHAEGGNSYGQGNYSHAEGQETVASGESSHSEGYLTQSTGAQAHAEGNRSYASGHQSHAQNLGTTAASRAQTAIGKYNIEDNADVYGLIMGNGTAHNNQSNALAVSWDGNVELAIDTAAATGTTDGDLYAAITALNWESEVIA